MDNRGIKRKYYEVMKNDLSVELHNLTLESGKYNNVVHESTIEFEKLFKTMVEKQEEFMTRSLLIEEQYRATIAVLNGGKAEKGGETVGENVVLPKTYAEDASRFAADAKTSLKGHGVFLKTEYEEMERVFEKYHNILKEKMEEMKRLAALIDRERSKLSSALHNFSRYVPDDSDEE